MLYAVITYFNDKNVDEIKSDCESPDKIQSVPLIILIKYSYLA